MASINPTSVSAVRPYVGAVNIRANALNVPAEAENAETPRKVALGRPTVEKVATVPARIKPEIQPLNDGPIKSDNVAPATAGEEVIDEPLNLSGISDRTEAVLTHTLNILMDRAGITDADTLTTTLSQILEPLVASDGVANPKAATIQYIKEHLASVEPETNSDVPGLKLNDRGQSGSLDLEG